MLPKQNNIKDISRTFDFKKIFLKLLSRWYIILLCSILTGGLAWYGSANILKPTYETEFTLCVYSNYSQSTEEFVNDVNFSRNMLNTYSIILKSNSVLERAAKELDYEISAEEMKDCITPHALSDTIVLAVKVKHEDPVMAKKIADALAKTAPEKLVAIAKAGWVEIIDSAILPAKPVAPNVKLLTAAGILAGFTLCCAVIVLLQLLDNRIYEREELESMFPEIPVLSAIPYTAIRGK